MVILILPVMNLYKHSNNTPEAEKKRKIKARQEERSKNTIGGIKCTK
jgi:hypothetical protein